MSTTISNAVSTRTYAVDKAHSEAAFEVRHLLSRVRGRFADFDGTIEFDPDVPGAGSVEVTIQAASINTTEPARDAHLRSADFFSVDEYPVLTFVSRQVIPRSPAEFDVVGDLTIRGVTRPVTLSATYLGAAKDPWGHDKIAFEAETRLNRKDFGLHWNAALETGGFLVGDEVRVQLSIQAIAK
jgi:polyisoprenoid-binding protein YceI